MHYYICRSCKRYTSSEEDDWGAFIQRHTYSVGSPASTRCCSPVQRRDSFHDNLSFVDIAPSLPDGFEPEWSDTERLARIGQETA
tara:strand:+ start:45 stop:299 length:255 start_codon:yes stop_codon:yes gene_type:complete